MGQLFDGNVAAKKYAFISGATQAQPQSDDSFSDTAAYPPPPPPPQQSGECSKGPNKGNYRTSTYMEQSSSNSRTEKKAKTNRKEALQSNINSVVLVIQKWDGHKDYTSMKVCLDKLKDASKMRCRRSGLICNNEVWKSRSKRGLLAYLPSISKDYLVKADVCDAWVSLGKADSTVWMFVMSCLMICEPGFACNVNQTWLYFICLRRCVLLFFICLRLW